MWLALDVEITYRTTRRWGSRFATMWSATGVHVVMGRISDDRTLRTISDMTPEVRVEDERPGHDRQGLRYEPTLRWEQAATKDEIRGIPAHTGLVLYGAKPMRVTLPHVEDRQSPLRAAAASSRAAFQAWRARQPRRGTAASSTGGGTGGVSDDTEDVVVRYVRYPLEWDWDDLTDEEWGERQLKLGAWVEWFVATYHLARHVPRCWALHPGLADELKALWYYHQEVYDPVVALAQGMGDNGRNREPAPEAPDVPARSYQDWHEARWRWMTGPLAAREGYSACGKEHQDDTNDRVAMADHSRAAEQIVDQAVSGAARPPAVPTSTRATTWARPVSAATAGADTAPE